MKKEETVNKITAGKILGWFFGVLFIFTGAIIAIMGKMGILFPLVYIIIGVIILPLTNPFLKKKFNFELSGGAKVLIIIGVFFLFGFVLTQTASKEVAKKPPTIYSDQEIIYRSDILEIMQQSSQVETSASTTATRAANGQITFSQAAEIYEVYLQKMTENKNKIEALTPPPKYGEIRTKTLRAFDLFIESYRLSIEGFRYQKPDKLEAAIIKTKQGAQELTTAAELINTLNY